MRDMKVTIDRSGCISCDICTMLCPQVFRIADDGLAEVIAQPDKNNEACAAQAAAECPSAVITIED